MSIFARTELQKAAQGGCVSRRAQILHSLVFLVLLATGLIGFPKSGAAQHRAIEAALPAMPIGENQLSLDDLMQRRLELEKQRYGSQLRPQLLKVEANYIRTSASSADLLFSASFHLEARYHSLTASGPDTAFHKSGESPQPIMYYLGSARTPLALPMVSNLSKALEGDEASYTMHLGILPLPTHNGNVSDSIRYYVVIERAIESNHSESEVRLERFAKEFEVKLGEPIPLKLENTPPEKNAYIVRLESGNVLDFYEDFGRFIQEHVLINSERLAFSLGKQQMSVISSRLSIPYSVASNSRIRIELLSVVDPSHPLVLVDSARPPADYLAEQDMRSFSDGPYKYRLIATDIGTGKELFTETREFAKSSPVMMPSGTRLNTGDTLQVGGKHVDYASYIRQLNQKLQEKEVQTTRLDATMGKIADEKKALEDIVNATKRNTIAGLQLRLGIGGGFSGGTRLFLGVEASKPALSLDVSFGFMGSNAPSYLSYEKPANLTALPSSPKSLGFEVAWEPVKWASGLFEPMVSLGYYGIWSTPTDSSATHAATLLAPRVGFVCEPLGEGHGLAFSFSYGRALSLGLGQSDPDWALKAYVRF